MTPEMKGKFLFKIINVPHCIGEQYMKLDFLYLDNKKHFVDRYLDLVKNICKKINQKQPRLYASVQETNSVLNKMSNKKKKIIVNIGRADKNYYKGKYVFTRNWKKEYMVNLVEKLSTLNYDICLLGGKLEMCLLSDYKDILKKNNVISFVNKTTIGESIALINNSILSVGVDTGMQHVADALGVSTLSIFGPTNPKTHGAYSNKAYFIQCKKRMQCQYCFGTDAYYTCDDRKCLNLIDPDLVFDKVNAILMKLEEGKLYET
jgi:ADP-heptose:LPS heptosyltransferase